jgi:hypothetical protein
VYYVFWTRKWKSIASGNVYAIDILLVMFTGSRGSVTFVRSGIFDTLCLFHVSPTLEHRASVECFVSIQFLKPKTLGRLLGRGINPSQGRYPHKHRMNANIYAFSGIRTHDSSVRASEKSSCLTPRWRQL